jgi:cobalt-zinc-cadmium efflux system outer membrane protein
MILSVRSASAALGLLVFLGSAAGLAGERPVTFREAAERSARNPRVLAGSQAQRGLDQAVQRLPRLDANPMLSIQLGPRVSPPQERSMEGSVTLSQAVSLQGAAGLRRGALRAEAQTAGAQAAQLRLRLRLEAARAWLDLWAAQQLHGLARQDAEAAGRSRRAVEALVKARERPRSEALVARRQAEEAGLQALLAEGALAEAREQLKAELGSPPEDSPVAAGDPPDVVPPSAGEQRAALASATALPAVRVQALLAAEERVRGAEERAARGSRLTLGVQVQRDGVGTTLQGLVGVPLPLLDLGGREEAPRKAAALRAEGDAQDALHRARSELSLAFHDLEHSAQVERAVRDELLPAAEQAQQALDREFEAGEVTLLEKIQGQRSLVEARARLIHATRDRVWACLRAATLVAATRESPL